ncbi:hypothetical protein RvY_05784 [Ramazzottius varieornatus]|uniref:WD repeat-containing protein 18 n=1 Tax=Ramazzottius varieornatus TaxID=947166 RepID=A0A1D1UW89_RAMVA|nr:hypothetical protein RvY_05784 [Ramazzottius varieornatus]
MDALQSDEITGILNGKDLFMVSAQPEEGADKLSAIECWSISSQSCQKVYTYRNSFVSFRTLDFIGNTYIAGGALRKPWISVWPLNQPTPVQPPLLIPSTTSALAISPDGSILVVAIMNKIHVYEISTGDFLAVLSRHYSPVSRLAFSTEGRFFVSAGQDGMVLVWKTAEVFTMGASSSPQVVSTQGRIEDVVFAGSDCGLSLMALVGSDHACRVYETLSASQGPLGTFLFRKPLVALTGNLSATNLAISDDSGMVYRLPLITEEARSAFPQIMSENDWNQRHQFSGHTKTVRCLQFNTDGSLLVTGSDDNTVRIWQVKSRVCVRVLQFKGPVTNLLRCPHPESVFSKKNLMLSRPLVPLQRQLVGDSSDKRDGFSDSQFSATGISSALASRFSEQPEAETHALSVQPEMQARLDEALEREAELFDQLQAKDAALQALKTVNEELYGFARENLLKVHKV